MYSFSVEPQPAALVRMASKSSAGKAAKIRAREIAGHVAHAGVSGQCAAADLSGGHDDFAAVGLQHADGGAVEFAEGDLRDAAREERDARAALALRRKGLAKVREEKFRVDFRQKPFALLQAEQAQNSGARAPGRPDPNAGRSAASARLLAMLRGIGQQLAIDEIARDARERAGACSAARSARAPFRRACRTRRPKGRPFRRRGNRGSGRCA